MTYFGSLLSVGPKSWRNFHSEGKYCKIWYLPFSVLFVMNIMLSSYKDILSQFQYLISAFNENDFHCSIFNEVSVSFQKKKNLCI